MSWLCPGPALSSPHPLQAPPLQAPPCPPALPSIPARVRDPRVLQSRSHGCSLSHHGMRGPPAAGLGVFEHPLGDGSWGGGGRKEQKDTGLRRGLGLLSPGGTPAALCSLALPRRALQRAEGELLLESSLRGEPCAALAAAAPWRAFLTSRDVPGIPGESLAGTFLAWPLLSPRCKAPGVATPFPRGPRTGSS